MCTLIISHEGFSDYYTIYTVTELSAEVKIERIRRRKIYDYIGSIKEIRKIIILGQMEYSIGLKKMIERKYKFIPVEVQ